MSKRVVVFEKTTRDPKGRPRRKIKTEFTYKRKSNSTDAKKPGLKTPRPIQKNYPKPEVRLPRLPKVLPEDGAINLVFQAFQRCKYKMPFAVGVNRQFMDFFLPKYPGQRTKMRKGIKRYLRTTCRQPWYLMMLINCKSRYNLDGTRAGGIDAESRRRVPSKIRKQAYAWKAKKLKSQGKNPNRKPKNGNTVQPKKNTQGKPGHGPRDRYRGKISSQPVRAREEERPVRPV